jgi:citronellol/citronellal dehydrogenase
VPVPTYPQAQVLRPDVLAGRVALVTGAGSGIGLASARHLAAAGADVVLVGRGEEALSRAAAEVAAQGRVGVPLAADVRDTEAVDRVVADALEAFGRIDVLVNNAGGQFISPAESISPKGFRAVTRLNLDATWYLSTRVAAEAMIPAGYGKIICITMTPRRGMPGMSHSSAARAAVESLTRTWAVEWGRHGVRTVSLAPGIVHTEAWERYGLDPAQVSGVIPLGQLAAADQIAAVVAFLAGPGGDYITGTTIVVDGGFDVSGPGTAFGA